MSIKIIVLERVQMFSIGFVKTDESNSKIKFFASEAKSISQAKIITKARVTVLFTSDEACMDVSARMVLPILRSSSLILPATLRSTCTV
mmetsp:Transcript_65541/g.173628  ORF Transcript_65541/g.173628 Transcript_65541/m.173628 type:complete len:89 (-) Transcript_65541:9-275(-)